MKKIYAGLLGALLILQLSCKKTDELASAADEKEADLSGAQLQTIYDQYYWSDKRKIPLATDSTAAIFLAEDTAAVVMKLKKLYRGATFHEFNSGYFVIRANKKIALESIKEVTNVQYSYVGFSLEHMIPTGEIVLVPNTGVDIDTIISLTNSKLKIRSINKYHTYLLKIEDNSSVLDVANRIYESGLVRYCHPDFLANIVPMNNASHTK